eukprot:4191315-Prymnesium_polylepis.1
MAPSAVPFPPLLIYFLSNGNDECRSLPRSTTGRVIRPAVRTGGVMPPVHNQFVSRYVTGRNGK